MKKTNLRIWIFALYIVLIMIFSVPVLLIQDISLRYNIQEELIKSENTSQLYISNTWIVDGKAISNESDDQKSPQICIDGAGGAIITWEDYRSEIDYDIYAQAVDSAGDLKWLVNGINVSEAKENQGSPRICIDGAGGAIITWNDYRSGSNYDIYAQRIDSTGIAKWTVNGTPVCIAEGNQQIPQICSDKMGGAIITWTDYNRYSPDFDIYIQRINSTGELNWDINGTPICTLSNSQWFPKICGDGSGGAIITWEDYRNGHGDIFAQKVNSTGDIQWVINGTAICTENGDQRKPQICSDGTGGAIITWVDNRTASYYDIYAQRINSNGVILWDVNGTAICLVNGEQKGPQICSDGAGDAIIAWEDYRSGTDWDVYAQKINSFGEIEWTSNGIDICTASNTQWQPQICSNGMGGAVITWEDLRVGMYDIYAQYIDSSGVIKWTFNGAPICTSFYNQFHPQICYDGVDGAIITWYDYRNGLNYDIYAQFTKFAIETPLNGKGGIISFGFCFLLFTMIGIIFIIVIYKRQVLYKSKY